MPVDIFHMINVMASDTIPARVLSLVQAVEGASLIALAMATRFRVKTFSRESAPCRSASLEIGIFGVMLSAIAGTVVLFDAVMLPDVPRVPMMIMLLIPLAMQARGVARTFER